MIDSASRVCRICGQPATHLVAHDLADPASEPALPGDTALELLGHHYCDQHVPGLHVERLEDRID
jgi:hypothetical protein